METLSIDKVHCGGQGGGQQALTELTQIKQLSEIEVQVALGDLAPEPVVCRGLADFQTVVVIYCAKVKQETLIFRRATKFS